MKKDHIALPDSTLKRFRESGEEDFFYVDLSNNQIYKKGPSTYQKRKGYYQKGFDDVCQRIETLMGNIHKEIDNLYKSNGGDFYTNEYLKSIAIDIVALQTSRRPELLESVTEPDPLLKTLNEIVVNHAIKGKLTPKTVKIANTYREILATPKNRRDYFYKTSFEEMITIITDAGQMNDYSAIIHTIPETNPATYLLTPYHFFIYSDCYIITLSPRYAIALMPNSVFKALDIREGMAILVADEDDVLRLIPAALEATSPCVQKHLIGERYMLNKVQEYLHDIQDDKNDSNNLADNNLFEVDNQQ